MKVVLLGATGFVVLTTEHGTDDERKEQLGAKIEVTKGGPYLVSGGVPLGEQWIETNGGGESLEYREGKVIQRLSNMLSAAAVSLETKPFCDGSHSA